MSHTKLSINSEKKTYVAKKIYVLKKNFYLIMLEQFLMIITRSIINAF